MSRNIGTLSFVYGVLLASVSSTYAQNLPKEIPSSNWSLHTEIKTNKTTYRPNEPVHYRAILTNSGTSPVYIEKSFFEADGGISGFYVSVEQLAGRPSGRVCVRAGDSIPKDDPRTPEQILREDYLQLPPGAMVGFEAQYDGCVVSSSGTYKITATYLAQGLAESKVKLLADQDAKIVVGRFQSEPIIFRVRDR